MADEPEVKLYAVDYTLTDLYSGGDGSEEVVEKGTLIIDTFDSNQAELLASQELGATQMDYEITKVCVWEY